MTKVGELPIQRSDGAWDYVDLHAPGTFDHDPLLVQLSDGSWGTPYLVPIGNGDTGLVVQDSAGNWWQANKQGILLIEDWEQGYRDLDTWAWRDNQFSGSSTVHSNYSVDGGYSLRLDGFFETAAMPDYPEPAPHLPFGVGQKLQFHFCLPHSSDIDTGQQYWFAFLIQDATHQSQTETVSWNRLYTVEAITGSNDLFRISRREDGTRYPYTGDGNATVNWRAGYWYRGEIVVWENGIGCDLYRWVNGAWNYEATVLAPAPKWPSGGIGIRSGGGGKSNWDLIRIVP